MTQSPRFYLHLAMHLLYGGDRSSGLLVPMLRLHIELHLRSGLVRSDTSTLTCQHNCTATDIPRRHDGCRITRGAWLCAPRSARRTIMAAQVTETCSCKLTVANDLHCA